MSRIFKGNMWTFTETIKLTDKKKLHNLFLSVSFIVSVKVPIFPLNMHDIIIYVAQWWEKYLSKRSLLKYTCSWRDKLIILGLYMSSLCSLHQQAAQHFDECFIRKHFWASQSKLFGSLGRELWETDIYIKFLQVTKTFVSCSFCLCTSLLTLTESFFSSTYLLKLSSSKPFVIRWSVSVMIAFPFLRSRFC